MSLQKTSLYGAAGLPDTRRNNAVAKDIGRVPGIHLTVGKVSGDGRTTSLTREVQA